MQQAVSSPSASVTAQTLSSLLAAHAVEPELQKTIPRPLVAREEKFSASTVVCTFVLGIFGFFFLLCPFYAASPWIFLLLIAAIIAVPILVASSARRKQEMLLQYGVVKPAVITQVEAIGEGEQSRVTITYRTSPSTYATYTPILTQRQIEEHNLASKKSITLLVNPSNEQEVVLYCLLDKYDIKGTMRPLPVRPAPRPLSSAAKTAISTSIAADFGVEPELYCVAPRRVVWSRNTILIRIGFANGVTGLALVMVYLLKRNPDMFLFLSSSLGVMVLLIGVGWLMCEITFWSNYSLLRNGYAVRAVVSECEADGTDTIRVRYAFPRDDSHTAHGTVTLNVHRLKELGRISTGSTFTVLRNPTEPDWATPYFVVEGSEPFAGRSTYFIETPPPPS